MKTAHDYMIGLPPAERTENVKAMVNIILLDAEIDKDESYKDGKDENADAYDEGHSDGFREGYSEGLEEGRAESEKS